MGLREDMAELGRKMDEEAPGQPGPTHMECPTCGWQELGPNTCEHLRAMLAAAPRFVVIEDKPPPPPPSTLFPQSYR